jgi:hypothetical protein
VATIPTCPKCKVELRTLTLVHDGAFVKSVYITANRFLEPRPDMLRSHKSSHWICGECGHKLPDKLQAWCNMVLEQR